MRRAFRAAMIAALAGCLAMPALADGGRGQGRDRGDRHEYRDKSYRKGCPPGLARKHNGCQPPGHARKAGRDDRRDYRPRRGEVLRLGDYVLIRDPGRFNLRRDSRWDYYRDDNRIYRVDSGTRKVLAVLELIDAFSN